MTDLDSSDGRLVLAEFVKLLLHATEDDGARRRAHTHRLGPRAEHVLMLPLEHRQRTGLKGKSQKHYFL
jgi:hypothetical protein